jgi:hypothetical protein
VGRFRPAVVVILVTVATIAVAASIAGVQTETSAPSVKLRPASTGVRVTGFTRVSIFGSSGATTISPSPPEAAAIMKALKKLPSATEAYCHENALLYRIAVRPTSSRAASFVVDGWQCESTVARVEGGKTKWLYDGGCALLRAVQASLPPHEAEGTRRAPCRVSYSTLDEQVAHAGPETVPTVVGRTLPAAWQRLSAGGNDTIQIGVTKQVVDAKVPPETVLTQTTHSATVIVTTVRLTIAVPQASPCDEDQLSLSFNGVYGGASQHLYAGFTVRNVSSQWCTLLGPVRIVGLGSTGSPITSTATTSFSAMTLDELSPDTSPIPTTATGVSRSAQFYPLGVFTGGIEFDGGDEFGCGPVASPLVQSATWQVTLPGTAVLTVPNGTSSLGITPFGSCQGGIEGAGASVRQGTGPRLPG